MITLVMDTSHKHLTIGLFKDEKPLEIIFEYCPKKQSEEILTTIAESCAKQHIISQDIDEVVITKGPGSYTGVRIAMTVAKVLCALENKALYTISTLDLISDGDCCVLMDARGKRAYFAKYINNECVRGPVADYVENLKEECKDMKIEGDGSLIGLEDHYENLALQFMKHKDKWERVENIHTLVPEYLKDASEYLVKK